MPNLVSLVWLNAHEEAAGLDMVRLEDRPHRLMVVAAGRAIDAPAPTMR